MRTKELNSKWIQWIIAVAIYSTIIFFTGDLLEFDPNQPIIPDYSSRGADRALTTCILQWNYDSILHNWNVGITEAPIFFPSPYGKFYSEHLFGHLIFSLPISLFVHSPHAVYDLTFQLNRLVTALAIFYLCLILTKSFPASLISGCLLIAGWNFGQIQNTSLGWALFTIAFLIKLWNEQRWSYVLAVIVFGALAGLGSGYLAFYTPVAIAILFLTKFLFSRKIPPKSFFIQIAVIVVVIAAILSPTMYYYKKVQDLFSFERPKFTTARFAFRPIDVLNIPKNRDLQKLQHIYHLSIVSVFQSLLFLSGLILAVRKRLDYEGWEFAFICLALLTLWMASFKISPYTLLAELPGFNGLRAAQRWLLFGMASVNVVGCMCLAKFISSRKAPVRLLAIILPALLIISAVVPNKAKPLGRPGPESPVYDKLAELPEGVIFSFPVPDPNKKTGPKLISIRMLYQLRHKHRMVQGYSGFTPPLNLLIEDLVFSQQQQWTNELVDKLATTGVRYLVVDSLGGNAKQICRNLRSLKDLRIIYDQNGEMIVQLPSVPVEHDLKALDAMWRK